MASQALGFYDLLNIAEQNSEKSERDASKLKFPSFTPSKNKKEDVKSKALSEGIRKFKAKQEEEKRKQEEEARIKRIQLMELRAQDSKSKNRVNKMLKMTKSANRAVVDDAINSFNDSVVDQHDGLQPDDDDYGFVSQSSQDMHKKLLQQYKTIKKSTPVPQQQKLHDIVVPEVQSLSKKNNSDQVSSSRDRTAKNKDKKPAPPSLSYHDLLLLANEKKDKPPEIFIPRIVEKKPEDDFEFGRPMTAKEKKEYLAEKGLRERVAKQIENGTFKLKPAAPVPASAPAPQSHHKSKEKPKDREKLIKPIEDGALKKLKPVAPSSHSDHKPKEKFKESKDRKEDSKLVKKDEVSKSKVSNNHPPPRPHNPPQNQKPSQIIERRKLPKTELQSSSKKHEERRPNPKFSTPSAPKSLKEPTYKAVDRRPNPPQEDRRKPKVVEPVAKKGRQVIESDEEYDSEMDDFIDDSECDPNSISAMIRQITGYDKRRYRPEDEEGECMETSAYDQMREESRSLRIGIKEDLEDMRLEEEEKKRKLAKQKQLQENSRKKSRV